MKLDVRRELMLEVTIPAGAPDHPGNPDYPCAERSHRYASSGERNRDRISVVVFHSFVSRSTCFLPARVSW